MVQSWFGEWRAGEQRGRVLKETEAKGRNNLVVLKWGRFCFPKGHWAMSRDIFGRSWGKGYYWNPVGWGQRCCSTSYNTYRTSLAERMIQPQKSTELWCSSKDWLRWGWREADLSKGKSSSFFLLSSRETSVHDVAFRQSKNGEDMLGSGLWFWSFHMRHPFELPLIQTGEGVISHWPFQTNLHPYHLP